MRKTQRRKKIKEEKEMLHYLAIKEDNINVSFQSTDNLS